MDNKPYKKPLPKGNASKDTKTEKSGIVPTESWLNVHGNAVFVNIPESDAVLVDTKYGKKISFITSLESLKRLVAGEIQGVNLGKFEDA